MPLNKETQALCPHEYDTHRLKDWKIPLGSPVAESTIRCSVHLLVCVPEVHIQPLFSSAHVQHHQCACRFSVLKSDELYGHQITPKRHYSTWLVSFWGKSQSNSKYFPPNYPQNETAVLKGLSRDNMTTQCQGIKLATTGTTYKFYEKEITSRNNETTNKKKGNAETNQREKGKMNEKYVWPPLRRCDRHLEKTSRRNTVHRYHYVHIEWKILRTKGNNRQTEGRKHPPGSRSKLWYE